ncbi:MAG: isoprenylcysteine carboxylmethyltransferase family protein [Chloroflexi bacterium]|nr:isoprenylcysteine carboxylmethyltransferase family protein [Chloroflexota bacterium]
MLLKGTGQSIAILAIVGVFYMLDAMMFVRYDRQRRQKGTGKAWGYTCLMLLLASALIVQPILLPQISLSIRSCWGAVLQIGGLVLALSGLSLHMWSRAHLQHFYTERVEYQVGHAVVDTGPYAVVRHPTFTSFMMIAAGVFLVNPALPTLLTAAYAFWDFPRAAKQEEALLSARLPEYADYMARTSRFIPRPHLKRGGKAR